MRKNLILLTLATIGLASCNGGFKKGENGMLYNIYNDKGGPKIKVGDFVNLDIMIKDDGDSVLFSTYEAGQPKPMYLPKAQTKGDIYDAIQLLSDGDSASVKLPADSIFKTGPRPPGFKGKYLVYVIKIEKVIPKGSLTDQVFQGQVATYMQQQMVVLKAKEPVNIKKYIDDHKLNVTKTDSGLYYVITKTGTGPLPAAGDTVVVNYTGKFLNGKVFDTNVKAEAEKDKKATAGMPRTYAPIRFPIGVRRVIPGWDEGLALLNKGAKATFVVPSNLAYGDQGNGPIGPSTALVFDVELVDIVHPNPNAPKQAAPTMVAPTQQPAKK